MKMTLRKVRDVRRLDLDYVLINPQDFDSEFHSDFEIESLPESPPDQQPEIKEETLEKPVAEVESKPRRTKKEEVNSDG